VGPPAVGPHRQRREDHADARRPQQRRSDRVAERLVQQQIVRAAIAIADRDGLDALTMRRVAEQLGAGTMSLYWHVRNKDELIELMRDQVVGEQTLKAASGDWRSDLATFARDVRQTFLRHPWLASLLGGRPPLGPNSLRQDELSLAIVSGLEVDEQTRTAIPSAVYFFVVGYVLREVAEREVQRHTGVTEQEWRASVAPYIERVLASGEYPNLQRVVAGGGGLDDDATFEFILEFLLDGTAARLRR
jgi:AcrR family transcriptional regulator